MTSIRIRPRFKETYGLSMSELEQRIREHLEKPDCPCIAKILPGFIVLCMLPKEQHLWSPQLSLSFEENENQKTVVRGLYGPNPTVWAAFAFGYAALAIVGLFLGLYGFSQYALGQDAGILIVLPFLGVAAIMLYMLAQFGQKLGVEQTFVLHHFFEESIGKRISID